MLKGHVFKKQIFGNQIFALFINTFLNGQNGISNNYKNSMAVTYSGSTLTVQSGAVCIQGRFLEEDSSTDISAGTDTAYCKLVIEIDLDKQNSDTEFTQGIYKVVKSTSGYPSLTQSNIAKTNSGVYQYELARFRTSSNGIIEFSDRRTYLDFDSIYNAIQTEYRSILKQLQDELASVEDGSAYILKSNYAEITGKIELIGTKGVAEQSGIVSNIPYPSGFTRNNCIVIAIGFNKDSNAIMTYGFLNAPTSINDGGIEKKVRLNDNSISLYAQYIWNAGLSEARSETYNYKIVLMKIA